MEGNQSSASASEYVVFFNPKAAFTIIYEDSLGKLTFVFEAPGPKSVVLSSLPIENNQVVVVQDEPTRVRISRALERTRAFLVGKGYEVSVTD